MRKMIPVFLALLLVVMLVSVFASVYTAIVVSSLPFLPLPLQAVRTNAAPETTTAKIELEIETEPETAANPPEELIDYDSVASSKTDITSLIDLDSLEWNVDGFSDTESCPNLFDGDTTTKYCCSLPPTFSFKLTESKKVTAYAIATANDNSQYGRSPVEFTLYGSTDGKDWKVLDYVQDGTQVIEDVDYTYYAFMVDADKQGDYQYYKFEVLEAEGGTTFQMSEFQLFTDK